MKYRCVAVNEELTLERRRERKRKDGGLHGRQSRLLQPKKKAESERKRMRVVWSLLHSDNCVGDRKTVMMMKDSVDSNSLFM